MKKAFMLFTLLWLLAAAPAHATNTLRLVLSKDMPASKLRFTYDAWCPNVFYIVHEGWGGAIFDMHIFEDFLVQADGWPAKHFVNNRRIDESLFTWTKVSENEYAFSCVQEELIRFTLTGRVYTRGEQVLIEGEVLNRDDDDWSSLALMCFRARNNPDFWDTKGERIYVFHKDHDYAQAVYPLVGQTSQYFGFWLPPAPYQGKLRKINNTYRRMVTVETNPCRFLMGNREVGICCLHCNVGVTAAPGTSQKFSTTITFQELLPSAAGAWAMYE